VASLDSGVWVILMMELKVRVAPVCLSKNECSATDSNKGHLRHQGALGAVLRTVYTLFTRRCPKCHQRQRDQLTVHVPTTYIRGDGLCTVYSRINRLLVRHSAGRSPLRGTLLLGSFKQTSLHSRRGQSSAVLWRGLAEQESQ
jgi:hypothetical protein